MTKDKNKKIKIALTFHFHFIASITYYNVNCYIAGVSPATAHPLIG